LLQSIKQGGIRGKQVEGALGTWAREFLQYFTLRDQAAQIILKKMDDPDGGQRKYVANFLLGELPHILTEKYQRTRCLNILHEQLRTEDEYLESRLSSACNSWPTDWLDDLREVFVDLTDPDSPKMYLFDGTPFLGRQQGADPSDLPF